MIEVCGEVLRNASMSWISMFALVAESMNTKSNSWMFSGILSVKYRLGCLAPISLILDF